MFLIQILRMTNYKLLFKNRIIIIIHTKAYMLNILKYTFLLLDNKLTETSSRQ
jgi:hypothetical protein